MLKGKLKDEFDMFYEDYLCKNLKEYNDLYWHLLECFDSLPFEFQKGVFEAFFKSIDYRIKVDIGVNLKNGEVDGYDWFIFKIEDMGKNMIWMGFNEYEEEAFKEAINKLNEILG